MERSGDRLNFVEIGGHRESFGITTSGSAHEKTSLTESVSEAVRVERKGVEPSTSALRTQTLRVLSENLTEVKARDDSRLTNGLTNSPENERGEVGGGSVSSRADSFSAALAMIASLPLSDAEKADAVRRLMAEQFQNRGEG
ncbi:hypothetical protein LBMAG52_19020 [Planctomycetia bacterium]|nr:hypothetical protein LBMAG52_19020 [Planctomycetia bacterium]